MACGAKAKDAGITSETLVVFAGDNGPEDVLLWRGSPGHWEGSYFAGGEGNLRTPCIVRWPGHVLAGQNSDDIMHVTDWFTTMLHAAGLQEPTDRVIDGVNQLDWLTGKTETSRRDGYIYWMGREMYGVSLPYLHSWTAAHFNRIVAEFESSVRREPLIPAGAPVDHLPQRT